MVDGTEIFQYDRFYNRKTLPINIALGGPIWFAVLAVLNTVKIMVTDGQHIFLITETGSTVVAVQVTDPNAPGGFELNPNYNKDYSAYLKPQKGEVIRGYRYKGGNPADPSSWVQMK